MISNIGSVKKVTSLPRFKYPGGNWRAGLFCIAMFAASDSAALVQCDVLDNYPTVFQIREANGALEFLLSGENFDRDKFAAPAMRLTGVSDDYKFSFEYVGDKNCREGECGDMASACQVKIPKIELSGQNAKQLRMLSYMPDEVEQNIKACVTDGDDTYFGISFYDGEGTTGVGGIGRFDSQTGEVEIRRPPVLRAVSVDNIAFDGRFLWIGTSHDYECSDPPPAIGLLLYDWEQNMFYREGKPIRGVCGFRIFDIHVDDGLVWVATELGVTQMVRLSDVPAADLNDTYYGSRHFAPVTGNPPLMGQASCNELSMTLLDKLHGVGSPTDFDQYYELFKNLARFRPHILKEYVDRIRNNPVPEIISQ
jgi:hypothetical protein